MKTVHIPASRQYDVLIGRGLLQSAGAQIRGVTKASAIMIVSDDAVWPLFGETVQRSLEAEGFRVCTFVVPHGESSKSAATYLQLLDALAAQRLTRTDALVALGGGVVGDLTGFAASTYLRGLGFIQIPTTLLAMVDSSVGGKTAIDLPAGKNLAGTFYQPWLVLCDPDCLQTLPENIFRDGCAEVIKYAVLGSAPFFDDLKAVSAHAQLEHIIETCVRMKRDIVSQDEFDRGTRQLLNLGHTFGHGIEACSGFSVSHGSAVAIGMAMMARAAVSYGLCSAETRDAIVLLLQQYGLPTDCAYPADALLRTVVHDKKSSGSSINLIVPTQIGSCQILKTPASELLAWLQAGGARRTGRFPAAPARALSRSPAPNRRRTAC